MAVGNHTFLAHYNSGLERLQAIQGEMPSGIIPLKADLATEVGVLGLLKEIEARGAVPDRVVFVAAPKLSLTRFKDLNWSDFQMQLDCQLRAAVMILSRFLPDMTRAKYGRVVFVLSSYTFGLPPAAMAHYVTAKYALLGLMKALSSEYVGKGICINAVSPSMLETDFLAQLPDKLVEFAAQQHPMKRNGLPEDVGPVVRFLLSDEARFLSGVNIPVTGGS